MYNMWATRSIIKHNTIPYYHNFSGYIFDNHPSLHFTDLSILHLHHSLAAFSNFEFCSRCEVEKTLLDSLPHFVIFIVKSYRITAEMYFVFCIVRYKTCLWVAMVLYSVTIVLMRDITKWLMLMHGDGNNGSLGGQWGAFQNKPSD